MESLTGQDLDPIADGTTKAMPKNPDRIALNASESRKVGAWLEQIREASKGYLNLSKSDIVNFLIREHRDGLLGSEIKRVRTDDHYDPIRHIQWIMPQIKSALAQGDHARVAELQAELRAVELSVIAEATTPGSAPPALPTETKIRKKRVRKADQNMDAASSKISEFTDEKTKK